MYVCSRSRAARSSTARCLTSFCLLCTRMVGWMLKQTRCTHLTSIFQRLAFDSGYKFMSLSTEELGKIQHFLCENVESDSATTTNSTVLYGEA